MGTMIPVGWRSQRRLREVKGFAKVAEYTVVLATMCVMQE